MKYIAHRGYSLEYQDNSLEAISEALKRGYDGIEIDVQLCKTGEIILYHDIHIDTTFVKNMTYDDLSSVGNRAALDHGGPSGRGDAGEDTGTSS